MTDTKAQIQVALRTPRKTYRKHPPHTHTHIEAYHVLYSTTKNRKRTEKNPKGSKSKTTHYIEWRKKLQQPISSETMLATRKWSIIFKVLKNQNC